MMNPLRGVVPDWLIVGTFALIGLGVAALVGFGIQQFAFYGDAAPEATPTHATHHPKSPTSSAPSATPTESAEPERSMAVSVFNATTITGLAARTLDQVVAFGWPRGVSGNWTGTISETTVFYPPGAEDLGKLLGADMGITEIKPIYPGMSTERLAIVLTAPSAAAQ